MRKFIQKFIIWLFTLSLLIVLISFIRIPNEYIYHKFENTQYNKINWFLQKIENGDFKEKKYKGVFLGSSKCYYGINDSILGNDYLNLGINSESRDMDLYMIQTFLESGGKTENIFLISDGVKLVSYGIHDLLPYLVSPNWLINNGQSVYSLHFYKYLIIRAQIVIQSMTMKNNDHENFKEFQRNFGVGYLDLTSGRKKPKKQSEIQCKFNYTNCVNFKDELLHNISSQWNFFNRIGTKSLVLIPSHRSNNDYEYLSSVVSRNKNASPIIILNRDSMSNLNSNYIFWADPDHLNRKGAIKFSIVLKHQLTNQ